MSDPKTTEGKCADAKLASGAAIFAAGVATGNSGLEVLGIVQMVNSDADDEGESPWPAVAVTIVAIVIIGALIWWVA
jgi:hypothetical protein